MLKGLALTPPVIGRITIGKVVEKNGKRLPEKDDEFTITSQIQNKDGWINHPLNETLRKEHGNKLRNIPVRLLFNDPDLNLRANYTLFNRQTGRPVCVGNGETCRRATKTGGFRVADKFISGSQVITRSREAVAKLEARLFPLLDDYQPIFIVVR